MTTSSRLAILGGPRAFAQPLGVSQSIPPWNQIERAFEGILSRRYFANNGPLVRELDTTLARVLNVPFAVCVTNESVGLMIAARALDLDGEIIVPALMPAANAEALRYAGLVPVVSDVDPSTGLLTRALAEQKMTPQTSAILAVDFMGLRCDAAGLCKLAIENDLRVIVDATHSLAPGVADASVHSFSSSTILSGAEGGCITTDDEQLSLRLRTMRNFSASETFSPTPLRINGKMSEAQAALALLALDELSHNAERNRLCVEAYVTGLQGIPGITLLGYPQDDGFIFQYVLTEINAMAAGLSRDHLLAALEEENIIAMSPPAPLEDLPVANAIFEHCLLLPNGDGMTRAEVDTVCDRLRSICAQAPSVVEKMRFSA